MSRRMEQHIRSGKGAQSRFGEHVWLDIAILGRAHVEKNLREVKDICNYFLGIDPAVDLDSGAARAALPMGGVRTGYTGQSQALKGLLPAARRLQGYARVQPAGR
ncbi:MAG: hypothetical protein R3F37_01260 [Candidatus Competibacteraceae bacterium]